MDPRATVEQYLTALSSADSAATAALVTENFVNEHTSELGSTIEGREAYAERLPGFLAQFAALQYEIVDTIVEGDRVAVRYRMTANCGGHPIDIPGVMLFHVVDGLVARRTDVWDSLTFLRQTGAVEER
ncbi:ester cyclase [Ilumatobacter sp.]|uniref:ester cyclase n=1 Tax=Ilumatobacter sp. TaxID=1967498 RepID=UPI003AF54AE7